MADSRDQVDQNSQLRVRAAWIYYVEGHTQNEVAAIMGLPRLTVTRLLSEARRRGEVKIDIVSPLAGLADIQRALEIKYGLSQAVVAPFLASEGEPVKVIAAAAGRYISEMMTDNLTVGVGWGRTLLASLPFIQGRPLQNIRVISMLGGIAQARRFNPAEFAWQFAELFEGEGFLVPAPAVVDSPETKLALLERCGLAEIFEMAALVDVALISVGAVSTLTTFYRSGHVSETERMSLADAGAVGDILLNFIDENGDLVDHPVNTRAMSLDLARLAKVPRKILVSGGQEKLASLRGTLKLLKPTTFITDEQTALALLD